MVQALAEVCAFQSVPSWSKELLQLEAMRVA